MKFDKLVNLYLENIAYSSEGSHNGGMENKKQELIDRLIEMIGDRVSDGDLSTREEVNALLSRVGCGKNLIDIIGDGVEAEMADSSDGENLENIWSEVSDRLEALDINEFKGCERLIG